MAKSLEALGWKSRAAIVGKFTPSLVAGLGGFLTAPSPDVGTKLLIALAWIVVGNLVALVSLLIGHWILAPAALDAEKQAEIDRLTALQGERAEQYPLPAPYGITTSNAAKMADTLRKAAGRPVKITLDLDASEARNICQQVTAVFRESGWSVAQDEVMGLDSAPECGVSLLQSKSVSYAEMATVRLALFAGGIDFIERRTNAPVNVPWVAFSRRDPYWTPPAKYA